MTKVNTFIISDLHLSDAEPVHKNNPLWKKFRRKEYFYDHSFKMFLNKIEDSCKDEKIELILNGDIFDFDSVMSLPKEKNKNFPIKNYEYKLGLNPMEEKSVFKIDRVLSDHKVWTESLRDFIKRGNEVIFVIGNHDIELNWKKVQDKILEKLELKEEEKKLVRFCEWFYISEKDTLVEHGHQYDPYCLALNPINPVIRKNGIFKIRLPFGNLANRFMINNMGLKNPHNDESYIKTFWEFCVFFFKYELTTQPLMVFTWLGGALKTFIYSFGESFLPSNKDPLTYQDKLKDIANKAKADVSVISTLRINHAHPAVRNPFSLLKELWLDRAFFLIGIFLVSWQIFSTSYFFVNIDIVWYFAFLSLGIPIFFYYAHGISSDIHSNQNLALNYAPISAKTCNVKRVVLGHTHKTQKKWIGKDKEIEYLNPGTWSIFFKDVQCTEEIRYQNFVWIDGNTRSANIYNWDYKKDQFKKLF